MKKVKFLSFYNFEDSGKKYWIIIELSIILNPMAPF